MVSRYNYDAFGACELEAGAELMDVGFTGREYDAETGLYHYRARVYDPDVGRFVQSDPIGFAAGDLNLYAYTWNDPSNWSDPSGLAVTSDWVVKVAQVVRLAARAVTQGAKRAAGTAQNLLGRTSVESATLCLGDTAASVIGSFAANYATGGPMFDPEQPIKRVAECAAEVVPTTCGCDGGGPVGPGTSFVPGTLVLTPDGKVAIEDLREGDLVIARHEETGELGEFPITSLMAREAPGVIWLTLEDEAGETARLGVTDEHPLFVAGKGWTKAGQISVDDEIRDAGLGVLSVASFHVDNAAQPVHNLEIAKVGTYFIGDLEAWGHNQDGAYLNFHGPKGYAGDSGVDPCKRSDRSAKDRTKQADRPRSAKLVWNAPDKRTRRIWQQYLIEGLCEVAGVDHPSKSNDVLNKINGPKP